jgi:hypothetical protein
MGRSSINMEVLMGNFPKWGISMGTSSKFLREIFQQTMFDYQRVVFVRSGNVK